MNIQNGFFVSYLGEVFLSNIFLFLSLFFFFFAYVKKIKNGYGIGYDMDKSIWNPYKKFYQNNWIIKKEKIVWQNSPKKYPISF